MIKVAYNSETTVWADRRTEDRRVDKGQRTPRKTMAGTTPKQTRAPESKKAEMAGREAGRPTNCSGRGQSTAGKSCFDAPFYLPLPLYPVPTLHRALGTARVIALHTLAAEPPLWGQNTWKKSAVIFSVVSKG